MGKGKEVEPPVTFVWGTLKRNSERVRVLMKCEVFEPRIDRHNVYFWSVLTEILIHVRNLIHYAQIWGERLVWKDKLWPDDKDITNMIISCRDALCHTMANKIMGDYERELAFVKNVIVGKGTTAIVNGVTIVSEFDDDALILTGEGKLYLKRHIFRAFHELDAIRSSSDPLQRRTERLEQQEQGPPHHQSTLQ